MILMNVHFLGFGEAAYELAKGLKEEGVTSIRAYDVMIDHETFGQTIKERAEQTGVSLVKSIKELIKEVNVLFVAVPASKAVEVNEAVCAEIQNESFLYVDVSASSPAIKQQVQQNLEQKHIKFVDAAMLGPLPVYQHKVPIAASGTGTNEFIAKMSPLHMSIKAVGNKAGDASAIKLVRSIFMKGLVGLYLETLEAAEAYHISDEVISSLEETMNRQPFVDTLNRLVTGSAVHAERRAFELNSSIAMLQEAGINSDLSHASKERLVELAGIVKNHPEKESFANWKEVLELYSI